MLVEQIFSKPLLVLLIALAILVVGVIIIEIIDGMWDDNHELFKW